MFDCRIETAWIQHQPQTGSPFAESWGLSAPGDGAFRQKSYDKMRTVLDRGITGILVSHSLSQVQGMCNKILWLDHGIQIAFSEDVETVCAAYEMFLRTKNLPENQEELVQAAEQIKKEKILQEELLSEKKQKSMEEYMLKNTAGNAVEIAIQVLKKYSPQSLSDDLQ